MLPLQAPQATSPEGAAPPKRRILGDSTTGAEVITGVLLHQTRSPAASNCAFRFSKLSLACVLAAAPGPSDPMGALSPYGTDPTFNPRTPQYDAALEGRAAAFYNATEGSGELSVTGAPFAFFPRPIRGWHGHEDGFPIVFEVCLPPRVFLCAHAPDPRLARPRGRLPHRL